MKKEKKKNNIKKTKLTHTHKKRKYENYVRHMITLVTSLCTYFFIATITVIIRVSRIN